MVVRLTTTCGISKPKQGDEQQICGIDQNIQLFMLAEMDFDGHVKARLRDVMANKDVTQAALGKHLGLTQQGVERYLNGRVKHWKPERVRAAEDFLGERLMPDEMSGPTETARAGQVPAEDIQSYGTVELRPDEIPIVYIWEFPRGIPEGQMRSRLSRSRRGTHRRANDDPPDAELIWVRLRERLGERMMPGDDVLMSPAAADSVGDGDFIVFETPAEAPIEVLAGQTQIVNGSQAVKTRSGRKFERSSYRILGKIIKFTGAPE